MAGIGGVAEVSGVPMTNSWASDATLRGGPTGHAIVRLLDALLQFLIANAGSS